MCIRDRACGWPWRLPSRWPAAARPGASRCPCRRPAAPVGRAWSPAGLTLGVEVFEVHRGPGGELFDLTLTQLLTGAAPDRFHGLVEGTSGAFDRGQLPQPVRVPFGG